MKSDLIRKAIIYSSHYGLLKWMPSKEFLELVYWANMGKKLNLKNPKTYNEKLQWLKLYDHNPDYIIMVDKYLVKDYVRKKIGDEFIIPTIGVWEDVEDINFASLPNQFVLKCTHDSGSIVICKDKSKLNIQETKKKLSKALKKGSYCTSREWPYKNVPKKIIAEPYLEDQRTKELRDYKFFAFDGMIKAMFVASDRQKQGESVKFDYFDENYTYLDLKQDHPHAPILPEKPTNFEEMKKLAKILSKGIPHVRVDFYEVNGKVYFGEMTFYHHSGFVPFYPEKWDCIFGNWIRLNLDKNI